MKIIENESGQFSVDDTGTLVHFACNVKNNSKLPYSPESKNLMHLHIPEGIRILPPKAFRGFSVYSELTLPDSLQILSEGAFSRCSLNRVTLPKWAELGKDVFSGSKIREVTIPEEVTFERGCRAAHLLRYSDLDSVNNWQKEYSDIFYGKNETVEAWQQLNNSSGTFFVDSDGVLRDFLCDRYNFAAGYGDNKNTVLRLDIPEGVKVIPGEIFENYTVLWELKFPDTLKCIGTINPNAFAGSKLPDMVLPKNLELLGDFSFGKSTVRSITIPRTLSNSLNEPQCVRDFKDSLIGEIRVPAEYKTCLEELSRTNYYGEYEMDCGEIYDEELGKLCYIKPKNGILRGGEIIPVLLQEIACIG